MMVESQEGLYVYLWHCPYDAGGLITVIVSDIWRLRMGAVHTRTPLSIMAHHACGRQRCRQPCAGCRRPTHCLRSLILARCMRKLVRFPGVGLTQPLSGNPSTGATSMLSLPAGMHRSTERPALFMDQWTGQAPSALLPAAACSTQIIYIVLCIGG